MLDECIFFDFLKWFLRYNDTCKVHTGLKPMCFYFIKVVLIKKSLYNVKKKTFT